MPTDLMVFKYGGHSHPPGEVGLVNYEVIPEYSNGAGGLNRRMVTRHRMHLRGELIYNGQAALHEKIAELIDAYADNGKTAGLYHTDDTPTRHFFDMTRNDIVTKTQVVLRNWPTWEDGEYTTARTFYIILEAVFDTNEGEVVRWREMVRFIGIGGPDFEWVITPTGSPIFQPLMTLSTQKIVQHGEIFAMNFWPVSGVPVPLFPQWEHQRQRIIDFIDPRYAGNRYIDYGIAWSYFMEAPAGQNAIPGLFL
jgi:hypothetical protein